MSGSLGPIEKSLTAAFFEVYQLRNFNILNRQTALIQVPFLA